MLNEYLRLLAKRESKEVLGKRMANLWLLTAVLAATFLAIAFSNGSMLYLSDKMNDPFTNWVDINQEFRSNRYEQFRRELMREEVQQRYLFDNVQSDHYNSLMFIGAKGSKPYLKVRFFEQIGGQLVDAILSEDNVVGGVRIPSSQPTCSRNSDSAPTPCRPISTICHIAPEPIRSEWCCTTISPPRPCPCSLL